MACLGAAAALGALLIAARRCDGAGGAPACVGLLQGGGVPTRLGSDGWWRQWIDEGWVGGWAGGVWRVT